MRPVGGVVFGILGDKTGRKRALQISMVLMFVSTFIMGCLPTMEVIGIWAPLALTVLRLAQGVSVGGQLVGSILFLIGMQLFCYCTLPNIMYISFVSLMHNE